MANFAGTCTSDNKGLLLLLLLLLMKYSNLLRVNWWIFVKCEPKSSQLKEPKT